MNSRLNDATAAVLPDLLAAGLDIVFCGTAAGTRSAEIGAYYAGAGNKFWPTLHAVGLTPRLIEPQRFQDILRWGFGLTDLAKFVSGPDSSLQRADFSGQSLRTVIARYRPKILAFTSKRAALEFYGRTVAYGLHPESIHGTRMFILTSPSGLASGHWQGGRHWRELAELRRSLHPRS